MTVSQWSLLPTLWSTLCSHPVLPRRRQRVTEIQRVLLSQLTILETMTPSGFLTFRDTLFPASGFQSLQFRLIEIKMGLPSQRRIK